MARSRTQDTSGDDPDARSVRIVIADALPIFRDGLQLLLGTDTRLQIVARVAQGPARTQLKSTTRMPSSARRCTMSNLHVGAVMPARQSAAYR